MCRRSCLGCLSIALFLIVVGGLAFGLFWGAAGRIAGEPPLEPVSIEGDCPEQEALAYVAGSVDRLEAMLGPLEAISSSGADGPDFTEAIDSELLDDLTEARDSVEAMDVPACAAELRDAELELADVVSRAIEYGVREDRPVFLRGSMIVAVLLRGVAPRLERITQGRDRLAQRFGYLDGDSVPKPADGDRPLTRPPTSPAP